MSTYEELVRARSAAPAASLGIEGVELAPHLFPHQRDLTRWALRRGRAAVFADTGLGKQQPVSEPVLTPDGWSTMGELSVGDLVIGSNGLPTRILGVYPQGEQRVYRLGLSDGTFVRAGAEHLWSVRTKVQKYRGQPFVTKSTREIAESIDRDWQLPMFAPVNVPDADLSLDPYTLGILLGDGTFRGCTTVCTDKWIGEALGWRMKSAHPTCEYVGYFTAPLVVSQAVQRMGLRGTSSDTKFVPGEYLIASPRQRLALLQGLLDTDGHAMPDGGVEFCSTSRALMDSVRALVMSLGGVARGMRRAASTYVYRGERRVGKPAWRVNVKLPAGLCPFRLPRKAGAFTAPSKYPPVRIIRSVVDENVTEEQVCIRVDAEDALYVTRDYILTHNTAIEIEWSRHVSERGRVLILAPLAVADQIAREAERWGVAVPYRREDAGDAIAVTNYEMLHRFDASRFAGVVCDESSILKSFDGKTRNALIESFAATPYKLACTATPAPNDFTELGNHSEFLGIKSRVEMLAEYFVHDGGSTQDWRLKGHAEDAFWRWVTTWGAVVKKPSDLGHADGGFALPPLEIVEHVVSVDHTDAHRAGMLFATEATTLNEQRAVRRATMGSRVELAAKLAEGPDPVILWCELNDESSALAKAIPGAVEVTGSDEPEVKAERLLAFAAGKARALVSKSSIAGFGLNLQVCNRMVFVGASHSYEQTYQAIRRCWRFGQDRPVTVHVIRAETDGAIIANFKAKQDRAEQLSREMVARMVETMRAEVQGAAREWNAYQPETTMKRPAWARSGR